MRPNRLEEFKTTESQQVVERNTFIVQTPLPFCIPSTPLATSNSTKQIYYFSLTLLTCYRGETQNPQTHKTFFKPTKPTSIDKHKQNPQIKGFETEK
ncbi:hypothetical protein LguiB_001718 [Lonicera macranthoides]